MIFKFTRAPALAPSGQLKLLKTDPVSFFAASRSAGMRSYGVFAGSRRSAFAIGEAAITLQSGVYSQTGRFTTPM